MSLPKSPTKPGDGTGAIERKKVKVLNALDFLDFILEKHHEGETPEEEYGERDPCWEHEYFTPLCDGCEPISAIDK